MKKKRKREVRRDKTAGMRKMMMRQKRTLRSDQRCLEGVQYENGSVNR